MTDYDKPIPEFYSNGTNPSEIIKSELYSTRTSHFIHNIKPIPFMPKVCTIDEIHKFYSISQKEFIFEVEVRSSKIPYSDSFYLVLRYKKYSFFF